MPSKILLNDTAGSPFVLEGFPGGTMHFILFYVSSGMCLIVPRFFFFL